MNRDLQMARQETRPMNLLHPCQKNNSATPNIALKDNGIVKGNVTNPAVAPNLNGSE